MEDPKQHRILMVSDFFYPNFGGVENHIYYLSQCLLKLGHKVVVMTHAYGNRSGVRYMTGGLKVYYVPWKPFLMQNTLPTFYGTLPITRTILIRENITLVHGHQAFSTLCHEALMHARTMGYKVVFTDHSLYGFADAGSIHMNKVLQFTLADVTEAICVSHTSKENTVLRSGLPPKKVFVIPNAVDTSMFKPALNRPSGDEIVIVVISRLVYRKGADLLVEVIPEICRIYPNVRFIVGGDGPKRVRVEEMREKHSLQDRVEMLGAVPHAKVRSVLVSGHIFLNSSLTEAFCIAILEAASCGLLTVSTRVGGVPEVLPEDMIVLAEPDPSDMVRAIKKAISILPKIDPQEMHYRMKKLYDWHDVARRTEIVYDCAMKSSDQNLLERLSRYLSCGSWAGKLFCLVMIIDFLLWHLLKLWQDISRENKLRLLMILAAIYPEKFEGEKGQNLMKLAKLMPEDMNAINNLRMLGGSPDSKKSSTGAFTLKFDMHKKKRGIRKERNTEKEMWQLSRFYPMIEDLVEKLSKGELSKDEFPCLNDPSPTYHGPSHVAAPVQQSPVAQSMRSRRATWARPRNSDDGYSSDSVLRHGSSDPKKMGRRIFVFIVGGATRSELRVCHKLTADLRREVVLGSSSLDDPPQFLTKLKMLSAGDLSLDDLQI